MNKGTVVLLPFPFTHLQGAKKRPAVVVMEDKLDVTVVFITSKLMKSGPFDVFIEPTEDNGLKIPSLIRVQRWATIDKALLFGILGELAAEYLKKLHTQIKRALAA